MSKRAEELALKIATAIVYADMPHNEIAEMIDAELRKAVEAAVDHILLDWLAYDDETDAQAKAYVGAHRGHLIEDSLMRLNGEE